MKGGFPQRTGAGEGRTAGTSVVLNVPDIAHSVKHIIGDTFGKII
jgi:hypothetical protein